MLGEEEEREHFINYITYSSLVHFLIKQTQACLQIT